jgi:outer membrane biosynthesis protein TonB
MQSNGNNQLNDLIPEWTSIIAVLSQNWSTPSHRGAMKLGRKALLWMPAKNKRKKKKKTQEIKEDQKSKIEKETKSLQELITFPSPQKKRKKEDIRQDIQAHGEVPQQKVPLSQLLLWLKIF